MKALSPTHIILNTEKGQKKVEHPLRQARNYALHLADLLSADPILVQKNGSHTGRLCFPFSYGLIWTRIKEEEFRQQLPELFDPSQMLFQDTLGRSILP